VVPEGRPALRGEWSLCRPYRPIKAPAEFGFGSGCGEILPALVIGAKTFGLAPELFREWAALAGADAGIGAEADADVDVDPPGSGRGSSLGLGVEFLLAWRASRFAIIAIRLASAAASGLSLSPEPRPEAIEKSLAAVRFRTRVLFVRVSCSARESGSGVLAVRAARR